MIPEHITRRQELDEWEQRNIIDAISWLQKARPTDILNETFIRKLHQRMFGKVWRWAGTFRTTDKNIGGPWYQIGPRLKNLCEDSKVWIASGTESPDEIAVRFHHRLVHIHPFPNGNGRHARLLTDLLLENILARPRFTWGSANLTSPGEARKRYIATLQAADNHDYQPLLAFVRS
ncbi:MAG: mobile mystery protein B [Proteobacteria bacterium]|nr:mobile mystery protein B [Pseudomonadota bacterium]MBU1687228.1 mobile mystery protein B [Pseudomonadota bacterium]